MAAIERQQEPKGKVMLILSGIGNILIACANLVQAGVFGLASYRVFTAVSEEHFDMLYLSKYPIRELGFQNRADRAERHSADCRFDFFDYGVLGIHRMPRMTKVWRRSRCTGAVFSLLTLVLMIYSRNILQIFQLIIWLL